MSRTINDIKTYLQILNIPNTKINTLINRDDLVIYSALRDKLSQAELLELQIVLRGVNNGTEQNIEQYFNKYVDLRQKQRKIVKDMLGLKTTTNLEIATILQMEPSELSLNIVKELL